MIACIADVYILLEISFVVNVVSSE